MNRGGAGARSLNIELLAALNPAGDRKVERFGWTFAPGDKVSRSRTTTKTRSTTATLAHIPQCLLRAVSERQRRETTLTRLRSYDVERNGLVHIAAEAAYLKVAVACV